MCRHAMRGSTGTGPGRMSQRTRWAGWSSRGLWRVGIRRRSWGGTPTRVKSQAADVDLLCNWWLPYQAISGRLWGRTGYYQQSGAYGFRDQLQDSQVWLTLEPRRCLEQILLHAAHQFADGSVYHWWH